MNEELEKLKSLLYTDSLTQYGKRKLMKTYEDIIKKKDKQIDLMAEYINNIQDCPLENCGVDLDCENRCDNNEELTKQCWKMYFESKVHKNE